MEKITILGTGAALVTRCYNTCFVISSNGENMLVDGGGGNTILRQLELAEIPLSSLSSAFITHNHSDHLLGMVWVVRAISQAMNSGKYSGEFAIYGHPTSLAALNQICLITCGEKVTNNIGDRISLNYICDEDKVELASMNLTFFDLGSTKQLQHGFHAVMPSGKILAFHGDEPVNSRNYEICSDADYLIQEAYCLYKDREIFKPYEKHHATVLDSCRTASELRAKATILLHSEDKTLETRQESYTTEGSSVFSGRIYVPNDLDVIEL